jgi:hypothetical protein
MTFAWTISDCRQGSSLLHSSAKLDQIQITGPAKLLDCGKIFVNVAWLSYITLLRRKRHAPSFFVGTVTVISLLYFCKCKSNEM